MLYEIEQNYNNNKLFYIILGNQNNICENVFDKISVLIDNFVPIKETDAPIRGRCKKIPNYKYKNVDYNDIENVFLKVYSQFKRKKELLEKAKAKDIEVNKNINLSNTYSIFLKAKKRFELEYKAKQPQIEEEKPQKYHLYESGACL